ncbi:competence protein A [Oxobacter pfennigii]|uniref:Competence protein A n=1 Tax=Oxobacter pfennigii TaxID=36849 RepID=A0A0P9AEI8_9CLOT|nr:pilus assembly protein PilM [Oxobacter pfennigii]KPU43735.1 competence protein A [Oxobacter pfennigii]
MLFNKNILVMDIGSRYVKVVQGKRYKNGVRITGHGICDVKEGSEDIAEEADVVEKIHKLLMQKKLKAKNVSMGIKGRDLIIRRLSLPDMKHKELQQAVYYEITEYLPIDYNEYVINSKKLDVINKDGEARAEVLLAAAPKSKIDKYTDILGRLKLKARVIDVFSNSMSNLFQNLPQEDENSDECIGILDIGYISATFALMEKGNLYLEREISFGTKVIDESIYNTKNKTRDAIDEILEHITKIMDYYILSGSGKRLKLIYIHGGGAKLKDIENYIKACLNVETRFFGHEFLNNIYGLDKELMDNIHLYINCLGLLLREAK